MVGREKVWISVWREEYVCLRFLWMIIGYVEVWEWKKREGMEESHERYLRWILGID